VVLVAALGVGGYFVFGGGGGGLEDDGPHKLTTPTTVLTEFKRISKDGAAANDEDMKKDFAAAGVKDGTNVGGAYSTLSIKDLTDPSKQALAASAKGLTFTGAYGTLDDPERSVDNLFAAIKLEAEKDKDSNAKFIGEPKAVEPDGLEGAIMKCQNVEGKNAQTGATETQAFCAWGDYSTIALVLSTDKGKGLGIDETAALAAKVRNEVRVKE
jgi:hypothetical protein